MNNERTTNGLAATRTRLAFSFPRLLILGGVLFGAFVLLAGGAFALREFESSASDGAGVAAAQGESDSSVRKTFGVLGDDPSAAPALFPDTVGSPAGVASLRPNRRT